MLPDQRFELFKIRIAFKGMLTCGIVRLGNDHIYEAASGKLLVQARRCEIHVSWDHIAGLDQNLRENMLGPTTLVGRY